jgi:ureidoglycolate lyase
MITLKTEPLTKTSFAPFGDVIEIEDAQQYPINQGFAERFNDLAKVDVGADGGSVNISIVNTVVRPKPIALKLMERHPLGSQIFYPLQDRPWLVVVCVEPQDARSFRVFRATGRQGTNYARNTWHFPLLVLEDESRFLVVDRKGPGTNLEEMWIDEIRLDLP